MSSSACATDAVFHYEADDLLPLGINPTEDEILQTELLRRFRLASLLIKGPFIDLGSTVLVKQYWFFDTDVKDGMLDREGLRLTDLFIMKMVSGWIIL